MANLADENKGYNGWTNYETWLVNLWMDNDSASNHHWVVVAREIWEDAKPGKFDWQTKTQQTVYKLSKVLKAEFEDDLPEGLETGLYADLINAALSEVDWQEIAKHWLSDLASEVEIEEGEE
jgi:hypothetical protein